MKNRPPPEGKITFPHVVRQHGTEVTIYLGENNGYPSYFLHWQSPEGRKRKRFSTFAKAKTEAGVVLNAIHNRQSEVLELTNEDRDQYLSAQSELKPTGVNVHLAALQFAQAHKILGGIASVEEAARFYLKRHGAVKKQITAVIVEEFIKERSRKSPKYLKDLRLRLGRFSEKFPGLINEITSQDIAAWLRGLDDLHSRSRLNYRRTTVSLFRFAVERGYLPEGQTQAEKVAKIKVDDDGEIGIFTPDELSRLLAVSDDEVKPYLALGAFAGIRTAEIVRLDWSEINFASGYIEIKKSKAKTKGRRLIKMQPNLVAWLQTVAQASGPVVPRSRPDYTAAEVLASKCRPKVVWKRNGLRHSYCSYRMAITQNEHQVSAEMGNSPAMVFANYRELVTREAADEWFAILPKS